MEPVKGLLKWGLVLLALSATGCATVNHLEVPIRPAPVRSFPEPPPAVIRIPVVVTLPIADLLGGADSPLVTGNLRRDLPHWFHLAGGLLSRAWRDPVQLDAMKDSLSLSLKVHYWVVDEAKAITSKGVGLLRRLIPGKSPPQEVVAKTKTVIQWDPDWHLKSLFSFSPPEAKGSSLSASTDEVNSLLNHMGLSDIQKGAQQFNQTLRDVTNVRPKAEKVWSEIQEPIYLEKGIWLLIQPEKAAVKKPHLNPFKPQTLDTAFEITAHPVIVFGAKPDITQRPLPPLIKYEPGPGGFHALGNVRVSYTEANRLIKDLSMGILGHVFKESGDRKLKILTVRFYGSGGKVVAEVKTQYNPIINFSGKPAQMTVYLVGTPHYLPGKRVFILPDLDFDIKTGDFLVQVAEWIFKSNLRKELRLKAKVPIGPKLDQLKARMDQILNLSLGPNARLSTRVDSLSVLDAYADNEGMVARVELDGIATMNVDWKLANF
jgi:hypothetical protein